MSVLVGLAAGGDPMDSEEVDRWFRAKMPGRSLLVVITATIHNWTPDQALAWLLSGPYYHGLQITIVSDLKDVSIMDLAEFDGVYVFGENTFRLASRLRSSGGLDLLTDYIEAGKPLIAVSAGAILMGSDLRAATFAREDTMAEDEPADQKGLNIMSGFAICTCYHRPDESRLIQLGRQLGCSIICIPKRCGVTVEGSIWTAFGKESIVIAPSNCPVHRARPGERIMAEVDPNLRPQNG